MPDLSKPDKMRRKLLRVIALTPIALATVTLLQPGRLFGVGGRDDRSDRPVSRSHARLGGR